MRFILPEATPEDIEKFKLFDADEWNNHFQKIFRFSPEVEGQINSGYNEEELLSTFRLSLEGVTLNSIKFNERRIANINFSKVTFKKCSFKNCSFEKGQFGGCTFIDCDISNSKFINFPMNIKCEGKNNFSNINANPAIQGSLLGVNLRNANLESVGFNGCKFTNADLRGVNFSNSNLTNTNWINAKVDRHTKLRNSVFEINNKKHPVTRDGSDKIKFSWPGRKYLNWMFVRSVGSLPIFEFSWGLFVISLIIVNVIGFLNETKPAVIEGLNNIPMPSGMIMTIFSTLFLAVGSTLYKIICPEKIQAFSKSQWVYEHGHPRVEYLVEALQKQYLLGFTIFLLLLGGGLGLWLVIWRVIHAFQYIIG